MESAVSTDSIGLDHSERPKILPVYHVHVVITEPEEFVADIRVVSTSIVPILDEVGVPDTGSREKIVNPQFLELLLDEMLDVLGKIDKRDCIVLEVNNRGESVEGGDVRSHLRPHCVVTKSSEHLSSPLTVAYVGDLIDSCDLSDFLEVGRDVIAPHLLEGELPVLGVIDTQGRVLSAVPVPSGVAKEDIEAGIN